MAMPFPHISDDICSLLLSFFDGILKSVDAANETSWVPTTVRWGGQHIHNEHLTQYQVEVAQ